MNKWVKTQLKMLFRHMVVKIEVLYSWVTKSSYETELRKMTPHFELLTWIFFIEILLSSY